MLIIKPKILQADGLLPISIIRPEFGLPGSAKLPPTDWISYLDTGTEVKQFFLYKRKFPIYTRLRDSTPFLYGMQVPKLIKANFPYHYMRGTSRDAPTISLEDWTTMFSSLRKFVFAIKFYRGCDWSRLFGPAIPVQTLTNGASELLFDAGEYWVNHYGMARVKTLDKPSILVQHMKEMRTQFLQGFGKYVIKSTLRTIMYEQIIGEPGYYYKVLGDVRRLNNFIFSKVWYIGNDTYVLKASPQNKYLTVKSDELGYPKYIGPICKSHGLECDFPIRQLITLKEHWTKHCLFPDDPPTKVQRQLFLF